MCQCKVERRHFFKIGLAIKWCLAFRSLFQSLDKS